MSATTDPDQLLTYPQAVQRLGVGTRDVQRMVHTERGYVRDAQGPAPYPGLVAGCPAGAASISSSLTDEIHPRCCRGG